MESLGVVTKPQVEQEIFRVVSDICEVVQEVLQRAWLYVINSLVHIVHRQHLHLLV
jgi:hypothetical protein